jgi:hypothetical protein
MSSLFNLSFQLVYVTLGSARDEAELKEMKERAVALTFSSTDIT